MAISISKTFPGPDNIFRKQFPNGVTVLLHENSWIHTASFEGSLYAGSCLDDPEKNGVASFVSASLLAGTNSRTSSQISEHLADIGASLSFKTLAHRLTFTGSCFSEDLPELLKLLKEILEKPAFPDEYLEELQQMALEVHALGNEPVETYAYTTFREILWRCDHPYGRSEFDDDEVTRSISRNDLLEFHRRFFGPKNFILAIAGNFNAGNVMDYCEMIFGSWEKAQEEINEDLLFPEVERPEAQIRCHIEIPTKPDVTLLFGTLGPAINNPDIFPARLGNCILGRYDLTSRIGQAVREKHGLAYAVHSILDPRKLSGAWSIAASVNPKNLQKASDVILDELRHFTNEPVTSDELMDSKSWYIGSLHLDFGTNSGWASIMHSLAFYHRDLDYYLRLPDQINAVTPKSILETANKWIDPKKLIVLTIGPSDEKWENELWWKPFNPKE